MQGLLSPEIEKFHTSIKARALLIAIEWAGNPDRLARMTGLSRAAAKKWLQRGAIPPLSALSLSRIRGFPLTFQEMCPGVDVRVVAARRCPHCNREIQPPDTRTGCSPILKGRSEAAARKLADDPELAERNRRRRQIRKQK